MLINTETTIATRCPVCGKLDFHDLSLFALASAGKQELVCTCGSPKLTVLVKKDNYWLQANCIYCEQKHYIPFKRKDFWAKKAFAFYCFETNLDLGFLGPKDEVIKLTEAMKDGLDAQLEQEDYFENPKIMFEVLNTLHDIAEEDELYCACGNNDIEIEILPKGIELKCSRCNTTYFLAAETEEDLRAARKLDNIMVPKKEFKAMDRAEENNL